jgi:hypothetical protein
VVAISTWEQTSYTDFISGTFNNVKIQGSDNEVELIIDQDLGWLDLTSDIKPLARCGHTMASVYGTGKVVLYGGDSKKGLLKDTWVFNLTDSQWYQKTVSESPDKRYEHAMTNIWGTDNVILHGGDGGALGPFSDTWIYNLTTNKWTEKAWGPTTETHTMAGIYGTQKVLLVAGSYFHSGQDITYIYNFKNNTWTWLNLTHYPELRSYSAMASIYGTDKVVLFGGGQGAVPMDDLWIYDLSDNNWTQKNQSVKPSSRFTHTLVSIEGTDQVLLYGGYGGGPDETWIYDLSENNWTEIESLENPDSRYLHAMSAIYGTDNMLMFGGWDVNYMDDTWVYQKYYSLENGTYTSIPFNTGSNSTFTQLSWDSEVPESTSIRFKLRTGANITDLSLKPFMGPDGNTSSFYTTSPSNIWPGHGGDRWAQYKVFFNTENREQQCCLSGVKISYNSWSDIFKYK